MIISKKSYRKNLDAQYIKGYHAGKKTKDLIYEIGYRDLEKQYNGLTQDNARLIEERNKAIDGYKELEQEYNKLKTAYDIITKVESYG